MVEPKTAKALVVVALVKVVEAVYIVAPEKVFAPLKVLEFASSVVEEIVAEPPSETAEPFKVIEEFCREVFGSESEEEAAINGIPVAPVTTKPLLPKPHVEVVLKIVVMFGVAPPEEKSGLVAVTDVTVPCGCAVQVKVPPVQVSAFVPVQEVRNAPNSFVVEALPALSTLNSVVVAVPPVVDDMLKSCALVSPKLPEIENFAKGVVEPIPMLPLATGTDDIASAVYKPVP